MAANFSVFKDIGSCTIGSTSIVGVTSITINVQRPPIVASGNGDLFAPVNDFGAATIQGTMTMHSPSDAIAIDGQTGTMAFTATDCNNAASGLNSYSIVNVVIGGAGGAKACLYL